MTDNYYPHIQLAALGKNSDEKQGIDLYCTSAACNRCGACSRICPTYLLYKEEAKAPRGRNQLLKLILESKIKFIPNKKYILPCAASCLQCGRCTQVCAAKIPTDLHMYELLKVLDIKNRAIASYCTPWFGKLVFALQTIGLNLPKKQKEMPAAIYLPQYGAARLAKNALNIINSTVGACKILSRGLFLAYAGALNTKKMQRIVKAIKKDYLKIANTNKIPIIVDCIATYRLLLAAPELSEIPILFISQLVNKQNKTDCANKFMVFQNSMFANRLDGEKLALVQDSCASGPFLVELGTQLPAFGLLAYGVEQKGLSNLFISKIKQVAPSFLVATSAADYKYLKHLFKNSDIKVIFITDFLVNNYDDAI